MFFQFAFTGVNTFKEADVSGPVCQVLIMLCRQCSHPQLQLS